MRVRWWLCTLLSFAKLHRVDCERCGRYQECWGEDIRKRLEELREFEPGGPPEIPASTAAKPRDDAA